MTTTPPIPERARLHVCAEYCVKIGAWQNYPILRLPVEPFLYDVPVYFPPFRFQQIPTNYTIRSSMPGESLLCISNVVHR